MGFLSETGAAVGGGLFDAVESFGEIGNLIPGVDYDIDITPDWATPETGVGKAAEGIISFAAGFIPVFGQLGKVGKLGQGAKYLARAKRYQRVAEGTQDASVAARAAAKAKKARVTGRVLEIARAETAGIATDFLFVKGNEDRLSNLIQAVPGLQNPITDFLANDEDDGEALGRMKNVLEGMGLGAVFGTLAYGLRSLKAVRKGAREGSEETVAATKQLREDNAAVEAPMPQQAAVEAPETPMQQDFAAMDSTVDPKETLKIVEEGGFRFTARETKQVMEEYERLLKGEEVTGSPRAGSSVWEQTADPLKHPDEWSEDAHQLFGYIYSRANLSKSGASREVAYLARAIETVLGAKQAHAWDAIREHQGVFELGAPKFMSREEALSEGMSELSGLLGIRNPELLAASIREEIGGDIEAVESVANKLVGYRSLFLSAGDKTEDLARRALDGDKEAEAEFFALEQVFAEVTKGLRSLAAPFGRGLGEMSHKALRVETFDDTLERLNKIHSDPEARAQYIRQILVALQEGGDNGMAARINILNHGMGSRITAVTQEVWMNFILSGSRTATVNFASPIAMTMWRPLENMVGGVLRRDSRVLQETMKFFSYLPGAVMDSLRMARVAWKTGTNPLDPGTSFRDDAGAYQSVLVPETFGRQRDGTLASTAIEWIGQKVRWPTRLIGASDTFVKSLNYRASMKSQLYMEAMDDVAQGRLTMEMVNEQVEDRFQKSLVNGAVYTEEAVKRQIGREVTAEMQANQDVFAAADVGKRIDQRLKAEYDPQIAHMAETAAGIGREVTFTENLKDGSLGKMVQDFSNRLPFAKFVVPFVKTPMNLMFSAAQRVDFARAANVLMRTKLLGQEVVSAETRALAGQQMSQAAAIKKAAREAGKPVPHVVDARYRIYRDMTSDDPMRRAEATGRLMTGIGIVSTASMLASADRITGRGPTDPEQRRVLEMGGWQPYSIRTANGYVSYLRADPLASVLGMVADFTETVGMIHDTDDSSASQFTTAVITAVSNQLTQKTFLDGVQKFFDAVSDPQRNANAFIGQFAGAAIPNFVAQAVHASGDPVLRETNSILDKMMSRIPGVSTSLAPMRNMLGEPVRRAPGWGSEHFAPIDMVMPLAYRRVSDSTVDQELSRLQHGFTPPSPRYHSLDLRDYEGANGQDAYDFWLEQQGKVRVQGRTLRQALRTLMRSARYQSLSDLTTEEGKSPRVQEIQRVLRQYRRRALDKTMRTYTDLRSDLTAVNQRQAMVRAGRLTQEPDYARLLFFDRQVTPTGVTFPQ